MLRRLSYFVFPALLLSPALIEVAHAQVTEATEYTFCSLPGCADGEFPLEGVVIGTDGNLYGSNSMGGTLGGGVIFKYDVSAGTLTDLYQVGSGGQNDGPPAVGLILGSDGNFYGTNEYGGVDFPTGGTVFKVTPSGKLTTLYVFCSQDTYPNCPDGVSPVGLTLGRDGNFYGTTNLGGTSSACMVGKVSGCGTIFKLTPTGVFTTLHSFDSTDGALPDANSPLLQGSDGNFYGVTSQGGVDNEGALFKISTSGTFTLLNSFTGFNASGIPGAYPAGGLVEGSDGNFYGSGQNYIFKITPSGSVTSLFTFDGTDGYYVTGSLVLGGDGNFYGTTLVGGTYDEDNGSGCSTGGCGTAFSMTPSGTLTTLYNFCSETDENGYCTNGGEPEGPLAQVGQGLFYGTASYSANFDGTQELNTAGNIFLLTVPMTAAAPVKIIMSENSVTVGSPVTANLSVSNAFSTTMQQCYAFQNGSPLGKVPGTYSSSTKLYTFSTSFTPTTAGTYNYAVNCGGVESGLATLTVVGHSTTTALTASPNPVTPPGNVSLTATVSHTGSTTPTGTVTFLYGSTPLGTAKLNSSGVATFAASSSGVAKGSYSITAKYSGDSQNASSISAPVTVSVN